MKFNKISRNALLAVALGDGHVAKNGNLILKHSIAQIDYLQWKIDYLHANGIKCSAIKLIDNSGHPGCSAYIGTTRWGKFLRNFLYKDGYKNIYKRKLLNRLSAIHIAIWYMDDGGLSQKKRNGIVYANELMLNTHTTKENNQILIDYFKEVWDVQFRQYKNRGHYRLSCGTKEARKFIKIVREYMCCISSMHHKINIKS